MSVKDRVVHMILFEIIALAIFIPVAMLVTQQGVATMTGLGIALSLIAMAWNFVYNLGFDAAFGGERISRTFRMRLFHGAGFELGMVITSFPVLMYVLQETFLAVLIMDIGAVAFFFTYAIVFNWAYDVIRHRARGSAPAQDLRTRK